MSLLTVSGLTATDLALRLRMDIVDDTAGLNLCLAAASDEIEPLVMQFTISGTVPAGLKVAILDLAAQRYDRTSLATDSKVGGMSSNWNDEYAQLMQRIAPYRVWVGL